MSPFVRIIKLTVAKLKLEDRVEFKHIDLRTAEHQKEQYKIINPRQVVPFLVDGDVKICESRAIAIYLISKYGNGSEPLYPLNDVEKIAKINEMLFYDASDCYLNIVNTYQAPDVCGLKREKWAVERHIRDIKYLSSLLENSKFFCSSNEPTLADLSIASSISMNYAFEGFDLKSVAPKLHEFYLEMCDIIPNFHQQSQEQISLLKSELAQLKKVRQQTQTQRTCMYVRRNARLVHRSNSNQVSN